MNRSKAVRSVGGMILAAGVILAAAPRVDAGESTKSKVRSGIEAGNWKVAYGKEFTTEDIAAGAVATYFLGEAGFKAWAGTELRAQWVVLQKETQEHVAPEVERAAVDFAQKVIKPLLNPRPRSGAETKRFGQFDIKAGVAKYDYKEQSFLPALPSWQPYIAVRYRPAEGGEEQPSQESNPPIGEYVGRFALQANDGTYLTFEDNGRVTSKSDRIGSREKVRLYETKDGRNVFQSWSDKFVAAHEGRVSAGETRVGSRERLRLHKLDDGRYAIQAWNDRYFVAYGGNVTADQERVGANEKLRLVEVK